MKIDSRLYLWRREAETRRRSEVTKDRFESLDASADSGN